MTFDAAGIALVLAALPALNGLVNLALLRPARGTVPDGARVSILIPARDEAANIDACLDAALAQTGVEVEVIVMDDGSTDGTAEIVRGHAARDARLRLVPAPPLPAGWSGKMHACARLAEAARGTHLLFVDADVRLAPEAAARLVAHAARHDLGLVSGVPRQRIGSLGEALTVPVINLLLLGYLPGGGRAFTRLPGFAAGCGQMILAERRAYEDAGGHAAIRATRHDGLKLPRLLRARGHRSELVAGTDLATCRMYRGMAEAWHGFLKNAREGMATPAGLPVWTVLLAGGHLWPFLLLPDPRAALALLLVFALRAGVTLRMREPAWTIALHPGAIATALAIQWAALAGRRAVWKGRGSVS